MTIGIAAAGAGAGAAILDALARVEAVADGAVGGFVSVAAMDAAGRIERAAIQRGGAQALLAGPLTPALRDAPLAVLMSSGPDRPEPLAQFTPARPGVGLVTGHRFPNARGVDGVPLAEQALDAMADGDDPEAAAAWVAARNPAADAGLVLLSAGGGIGLANTRLVERHVDLGQAVDRGGDHAVAVLHNSIAPHAVLATLTVDLVRRAFTRGGAADATVQVAAGLAVRGGAARSRVEVEGGQAVALDLATAFNGDPCWSAGLGPAAAVTEGGRLLGHARADPFLVVRDGRLMSIDGRPVAALAFEPIREAEALTAH